MQLLWASIPIYNASLFCTKASITLQYHRIFPGSRIRIACSGALFFLIIYGLWVVVGSFLTCVPVRRFWDDTVEGNCLNRDAFWLSTAIVHIVTDVVLLAMPMPILIRLNIPKRQRIALVLVFALGGLYIPLQSVSNNPHQIMFLAQKVNSVLVISVCITSGLRLESLRQLARSDDLVGTYDFPTAGAIPHVSPS